MEYSKIQRVAENESRYVAEVLDSQFRSSSGGHFMRRLEQKFAETFGVKNAIAFTNGTATMHAAIEALGVEPGDEIIVPPLTMSATTFAVLQANCTPVFADVDPATFNIDPESIKSKLSNRTRGIITVALFGLSPDMDAINDIAKANNLFVIEDNAECFLGGYKGRMVGSLGSCASFSFQASKHLTAGEGGMIITDDDDLALKIRQVNSLGYAGVTVDRPKISKEDIQHPNYDRHVSMGWNYRMSELCAAVALAQVERIDELVSYRVTAARMFLEVAAPYSEWFRPQFVPEGYSNSYWTCVFFLDESVVSWSRFRSSFLQKGGDAFYAAWKLTYLEPMFKNMSLLGREHFISPEIAHSYKEGLCPVAEALQPGLVCFKTNYFDLSQARKQADILSKTLHELSAIYG